MSKAEKEYITKIDEIILNSSVDVLKRIQEIDLKTQLSAKSFYDIMLTQTNLNSEITILSDHSDKKKRD